ncbi:unnamed protein product [Acanthoscelides obtectus]|uniref:Uncharacterized protein n=1 Tax=Acanthoscelides obtectus TaxID=200917 RepID=A0A9P0M3J3_ACAOB|nr:unnamed protein product [Acanthoscelides obtectus]CAK1621428.1 hypothetical protein AOBTE_LOCUS947 [Acanthoscelides obtectus]
MPSPTIVPIQQDSVHPRRIAAVYCEFSVHTSHPVMTDPLNVIRKKLLATPTLQGVALTFSQEVKYLGVVLDCTFSYKQHVDYVYKKSIAIISIDKYKTAAYPDVAGCMPSLTGAMRITSSFPNEEVAKFSLSQNNNFVATGIATGHCS